MAWILLIIAGLFETVWVVSLKYSEGFTKLWPSFITIVAMAISIYLLAIAMKSLPLGTSYAVWTSIGAIGAVIFGVVFFGESKDLLKIVFVAMIIGGIVGLKVISSKESKPGKAEQSQSIGSKSETSNNTNSNA
ncbi:MAG: quaternary ammonium compound-resistance protein SugE [Bacteroidetes bacterium HGW-Bacteroidetes-11]|jgi:quaternary ammonium compound-resistance protein SugE|nr:MAG: quaternary ammonium compound-resistance protein SugE [Bacteroidetes bacterium HGW-Bacteroidetes-11]